MKRRNQRRRSTQKMLRNVEADRELSPWRKNFAGTFGSMLADVAEHMTSGGKATAKAVHRMLLEEALESDVDRVVITHKGAACGPTCMVDSEIEALKAGRIGTPWPIGYEVTPNTAMVEKTCYEWMGGGKVVDDIQPQFTGEQLDYFRKIKREMDIKGIV